MATPNIRPVSDHRECWRLDYSSGRMAWWGRPGDLRRCEHGRLQLRTEVPAGSRSMGPGTDWWRDLHPILTPILWRRAMNALNTRSQ